MAADLQDAPRHAGQVVRRVLLRRNIAIDAETAQLVAAVQATLQAGAPSRRSRRRPQARPSRNNGTVSGATWSSCRSQARSRPTYSCVRYQVGQEPGIGPTQLTCPNTDTDHTDQTLPILFAPLFLKGRNRAPERPSQPRRRVAITPACPSL